MRKGLCPVEFVTYMLILGLAVWFTFIIQKDRKASVPVPSQAVAISSGPTTTSTHLESAACKSCRPPRANETDFLCNNCRPVEETVGSETSSEEVFHPLCDVIGETPISDRFGIYAHEVVCQQGYVLLCRICVPDMSADKWSCTPESCTIIRMVPE